MAVWSRGYPLGRARQAVHDPAPGPHGPRPPHDPSGHDGILERAGTRGSNGAVMLPERDGSVLTRTLDRPDRLNGLNPEVSSTLLEELQRGEEDLDVRAGVLTGAGFALCAGADLKANGGTSGPGRPRSVRPSRPTGESSAAARSPSRGGRRPGGRRGCGPRTRLVGRLDAGDDGRPAASPGGGRGDLRRSGRRDRAGVM